MALRNSVGKNINIQTFDVDTATRTKNGTVLSQSPKILKATTPPQPEATEKKIYEVFEDLKSWSGGVDKGQIQGSHTKLEQFKNDEVCSQKNWNGKGNDFTPCAVNIPKNPKQYEAYLKASEQSFKFLILELLKSDKIDLGTISGNQHTGGNIKNLLGDEAYNWLMSDLVQGSDVTTQQHFTTIFNNINTGEKIMTKDIYGVTGLNKLNTGDLQYTVTEADITFLGQADKSKVAKDTAYTLPESAENTALIKVILNNIQGTTEGGTTKTADENKLDFLMGQYANNNTLWRKVLGEGEEVIQFYLGQLHTLDHINFTGNLIGVLSKYSSDNNTPLTNLECGEVSNVLEHIKNFTNEKNIGDQTEDILKIKGWNDQNILFMAIQNESDGIDSLITLLKNKGLFKELLLNSENKQGENALNASLDVDAGILDSIIDKLDKGAFLQQDSDKQMSFFAKACKVSESEEFTEILNQLKKFQANEQVQILSLKANDGEISLYRWLEKDGINIEDVKTYFNALSSATGIENLLGETFTKSIEQGSTTNIEALFSYVVTQNSDVTKKVYDEIEKALIADNIAYTAFPESIKEGFKTNFETNVKTQDLNYIDTNYEAIKSVLEESNVKDIAQGKMKIVEHLNSESYTNQEFNDWKDEVIQEIANSVQKVTDYNTASSHLKAHFQEKQLHELWKTEADKQKVPNTKQEKDSNKASFDEYQTNAKVLDDKVNAVKGLKEIDGTNAVLFKEFEDGASFTLALNKSSAFKQKQTLFIQKAKDSTSCSNMETHLSTNEEILLNSACFYSSKIDDCTEENVYTEIKTVCPQGDYTDLDVLKIVCESDDVGAFEASAVVRNI